LVVCGVLPAPGEAQFSQQGPKLVDTAAIGNAFQGSEQGFSVSLSADGNTAIVGGINDNNGAGAAWMFTRKDRIWGQQAKLVATGAIGPAAQGFSVSLSADGNTALVGGPFDNDLDGAAWVFTRSGETWNQQAKLFGTNGERFMQGRSVSLSDDGNSAIVAGPNGSVSGAAWVFTRSRETWSQQSVLVPEGATTGFAFSVSLSGDGNTAIIGDISGSLVGAAWIFTRSEGVWTQQAKLVGTGAIRSESLSTQQGLSVSLSTDGNTAVVGGPFDNNQVGAAWIFTRSDGVWNQQGPKLVGAGAVATSGVRQGWSVSLSGDGNTAIVGGSLDDNGAGAAWVYTRSSGVWSQKQPKLIGTGAIGPAFQGDAVALSGDGRTAMVGGPADDNDAGASWVYVQPVFAGTPGKANCHGKSVSALAKQFGGLSAAAAALGFDSVSALQEAIMAFCDG
jgi:hypothetical protein